MKARTISIIGLGRTGTSVGLALKASNLDATIIGHDRDRKVAKDAKAAGAIDDTTWRLVSAASKADILIMAIPSTEVEDTLKAIGQDVQEHTLILDFSGLKGPAQRWAEKYLKQGHFVGARPILAATALADGTAGVRGARADLFQESIFCLMPSPAAEPKAVETAVNLGTLIGAKPFFLDADEYDTLVLGLEGVPGLMAAALFRAITQSPGWRDMLRFANLAFAQATQPLEDGEALALYALNDQQATLRWLDAVIEELKEVRRWVFEGEQQQLAAQLEKLDIDRESWLHERAENEWDEVSRSDFRPLSLTEHVLGRRGGTDV